MKLGIRLESLGLPFRQTLPAAARQGVGGVQFDTIGDLLPDRLSATGRREVTHLLRSHNLELTALGCPMHRGLDDPENLDARIAFLQQALSLSFDLGARRILVDAGAVNEKDDDPRRQTLRESLSALGSYADRVGSTIALEIGTEPPEHLDGFLQSLNLPAIGVNFDPANLLIHGHDPNAAVTTLEQWIMHANAHDARRGGASRLARSIPIGGGDVDWMALLGTLAANDYCGWMVVKTDDPDPAAIEAGVKFLRRLI
jgi:sugar phosphate isomerase/epimerase